MALPGTNHGGFMRQGMRRVEEPQKARCRKSGPWVMRQRGVSGITQRERNSMMNGMTQPVKSIALHAIVPLSRNENAWAA